jgi:hypothetical protein
MNIDNIKFNYNGIILENQNTLGSYGINKQSSIYWSLSLR